MHKSILAIALICLVAYMPISIYATPIGACVEGVYSVCNSNCGHVGQHVCDGTFVKAPSHDGNKDKHEHEEPPHPHEPKHWGKPIHHNRD